MNYSIEWDGPGEREATPNLESAIEASQQARTAIVAASVASCTCLCKSPEPQYHAADCRYVKLLFAMDCLDTVDEHLAGTST